MNRRKENISKIIKKVTACADQAKHQTQQRELSLKEEYDSVICCYIGCVLNLFPFGQFCDMF